ncbi:hypothetical protein [Nocardioides convexus]|uniref:hypothetical protein n=1 Tax=Nocardioides convexus TaxID=2712224 RepID=UPI00241898D3|nr:hypothetical protein [Nocardioides convexus]
MGPPSDARAHLDALIAAAAPDPVPARQAIALLQPAGRDGRGGPRATRLPGTDRRRPRRG